jgi:hypothetical protein
MPLKIWPARIVAARNRESADKGATPEWDKVAWRPAWAVQRRPARNMARMSSTASEVLEASGTRGTGLKAWP